MRAWIWCVCGGVGLLAVLPRRLRKTFTMHPPGNSAVLVTGVSSGIGLALAKRLVGLGFTVFGTVRKQADADALLSALPERFIPVICDVAYREQVAEAHKSVQTHLESLKGLGIRLTAVVNNAGVMFEVTDLEIEKFQNMVNVNVLGVYRVAEAFMPHLLETRGRMVLVGSYFGTFTTARHAEYAATKHANEALADGFRRRYADRGVAVSLVKPGNIASEMNREHGESDPRVVEDAVVDALRSSRPLERYYPGRIMGSRCWFVCHFFLVLPDLLADYIFGRPS